MINSVTGMSTLIGSVGTSTNYINATGIAGGGYQYNWLPAEGLNKATSSAPLAAPLTTTTYTLQVTDMCGNTASAQVTVQVNNSTNPPVITGPTDSICAAASVRLSASKKTNYVYQWYRDGRLITGATDSFYVANRGGTYTVSASLPNECAGFIVALHS